MLGVRWRVAKFLSKSVLLETTNIPSSDLTASLYAKRAWVSETKTKQTGNLPRLLTADLYL